MQKPSTPIDEMQRMMNLHSLRILDTPSEERYDRITRMAKRLFGVEICLISLVDADRQWFKSNQGLGVCETSREISLCGHAILGESVFVVNDASRDSRFADNPLVTDVPSIRFYAGLPIKSPDGFRIGTLCLIDPKPREFTTSDIEALADLAAMVEDEIRISSRITIDELTKVANRRGFNLVADHLLSLCRRTGTSAEVVFFDLDGFKMVNETHGHAAGDELLKHFASLLVKCFRTADAIGRLGSDEFIVLLGDSAGCSRIALERLERMAADSWCPVGLKLAWSAGSVQFDPDRHSNIESLLTDADSRMYDNKKERRIANA